MDRLLLLLLLLLLSSSSSSSLSSSSSSLLLLWGWWWRVAVRYLFEALWEANDDSLIQMLGEAMISRAHLMAMAESHGSGGGGGGTDAHHYPQSNNNTMRLIVDALRSAGDRLLDIAGVGDDDYSPASVATTATTATAGDSVFAFWTACRLLEHLLRANATAKELALRVPLGGDDGTDDGGERKFLLGFVRSFVRSFVRPFVEVVRSAVVLGYRAHVCCGRLRNVSLCCAYR